ncbi:hypothetical protein [Cellulophaga sp. Asnod2-G02]|uniref:hypothetical protein n=1 Tax=Cellulophaga sp. Asnod2-G02 TaxID=3160572 RepID=UPI00386D91D8
MKKILFLLLILNIWNLTAQDKKTFLRKNPFKIVTIILKNGDTINGLGKVDAFKEVVFKKHKDSSKSKYNYKTIQELIVYSDSIQKKYVYKMSRGKLLRGKMDVSFHLLEPLMQNRISIYLENITVSSNFGNNFPSSTLTPVFYISKGDSDLVTLLEPNSYTSPTSKNPYTIKRSKSYNPFKQEFYEDPIFILNDLNINPNTRYFRKIANKHFSDCEELMTKIESEFFDKYSFLSILNYYNNKCE